ncbi:MAG TPA: ABC transporter permease [Spirochaetota bacterium]|nr:ABC transporter permease [Spirochaetota bacterium]HPI91298.1 ABC transporter permease [Spirochaetota bacterium]HPR48192.1 ABC transporter permease [Spirochaetota bacterium]
MDRFNRAFIIMRKELKAYFISPIAYIVIALFVIFTGFFFFKDFFYFNQAEMRNFFQLLPLMFTFVVPAVTMRLFSEERQSGSLEILMTLPVTSLDVVAGKFLAGTVFTAVMIAPTLLYVITLLIVGSPDPGPIIGGYIGAILLGGAYTSIGVLASSLSRNQVIGFITAWAACFSLWLVDKIVFFMPSFLGFLEYLGSDTHFQNISKGVIDTRDIIYFVSIMALCMLATVKTLDERR